MAEQAALHRAAAGGVLTVDLGALQENYRALRALCRDAQCAAAVKADAYGIGLAEAAAALAQAGCSVFFVALPDEAELLLGQHGSAVVYVLNGFAPDTAAILADAGMRPVIGSRAELDEWWALCDVRDSALPYALHVDTGINRLGMEAREVDALCNERLAYPPSLVMSHLACADQPDHPLNARQLERFRAVRARLPGVPASLANSAGTMNGTDYHFDMVRPGIALYGGRALEGGANTMHPVVRLDARVIQVRSVEAGESVGYGATWTARRRSRIAVVSAGYGDGYPRLAGDSTVGAPAHGYAGGRMVPVVGRVSMDLIALDVTDVADGSVDRGSLIELLGDNISVDDLAAAACTIGYEVLTNLGRRYRRVYLRA